MVNVLVSVHCPAISWIQDVYLPVSLTVKDISILLAKGLEDITNHRYVSSGNEILCLKDKGAILNEALYLKDCGIQNGDSLVLI